VFKNLLNAALIWAFLSSDLSVNVVDMWIFLCQYSMYFSENMKAGNWSMKTVLILCINIMCRWKCLKLFLVFTLNFINENLYSHGRCKISNLSNRPLHEFLSFAATIILTIFFCEINIFLKDKLPHWIFYYQTVYFLVQMVKKSAVKNTAHKWSDIQTHCCQWCDLLLYMCMS